MHSVCQEASRCITVLWVGLARHPLHLCMDGRHIVSARSGVPCEWEWAMRNTKTKRGRSVGLLIYRENVQLIFGCVPPG